jgi:hypothetical protein
MTKYDQVWPQMFLSPTPIHNLFSGFLHGSGVDVFSCSYLSARRLMVHDPESLQGFWPTILVSGFDILLSL